MDIAYVVAAALGAGILGALGPVAIARLPEPAPHPEDDPDEPPKVPYVDLARRRHLAPGLALTSALLVLVAAPGLDEQWLLPAWTAFAGAGSWLAWIDLRTRLLPYLLTLPLHAACLALVALAALLADDLGILLRGLVGNVAVFAVFRAVYALGRWVRQPFGFGDVRLAALMGLLLGAVGPSATLYGTYAGFVVGAVAGVVLYRTGRIGRRDPFAFGPYLLVGAFLGPPLAALVHG
ncbi:MAG: prepilin peptidase [Propionibacteriales bacterium]|nr:prepilin peptidase [Propionibacteriales bacterium]